jgi:uncharacterized protein (TIGR03435 family)
MRAIAAASLLLFEALAGAGQSATAPPEFDVLSVKRIPDGRYGGACLKLPARLSCTGALMADLIREAYNVERYQVAGPSWVDSNVVPVPDMFAVEATFPEGTSDDQIRLMFQSALAKRFGLAAHHETREFGIYALVIDQAGSKLKPAAPGEPFKVSRGRGRFATQAGPIRLLITNIRSEVDRPVLDRTGLDGAFDFALEWTPSEEALRPDAPPANLLDVFGALRSQLGLRLVPQKAPIDVLVIDKVDRIPSEN